jgi:hypothetical protein
MSFARSMSFKKEGTMDGEFYVCCRTNDNSIWTRWRWRSIAGECVVEPQTDFTTLRACKADASMHGFDPRSSRVRKVEGQLPPYDGHLHQLSAVQPAA